jgi:hypothetical protein
MIADGRPVDINGLLSLDKAIEDLRASLRAEEPLDIKVHIVQGVTGISAPSADTRTSLSRASTRHANSRHLQCRYRRRLQRLPPRSRKPSMHVLSTKRRSPLWSPISRTSRIAKG